MEQQAMQVMEECDPGVRRKIWEPRQAVQLAQLTTDPQGQDPAEQSASQFWGWRGDTAFLLCAVHNNSRYGCTGKSPPK